MTTDDAVDVRVRGRLEPVRHRGWWITSGVLAQLVGVGVPALYVTAKANQEDLAGLVTVVTVKLAWHQSLHTRVGIDVLVSGAVVFALGSVLAARPFVKRRRTLLLAVPLAAACGLLVAGVIVLFVALLFVGDGADFPILDSPGGGKGRAKPGGPEGRSGDVPGGDAPTAS